MKRLFLILTVVAAAFAVPAVAAQGSRVDFAVEGRDAALDRPLLSLHGKNLHRFVDYALRDADGVVLAVPDVVYAAKDSLVLGFPQDLLPGSYSLDLYERSGAILTVPAAILNGGIKPGAVRTESLDPSLVALLAGFAHKSEVAALKTDLDGKASKADLNVLATKEDLLPLAPRALKGTRARVSTAASLSASSDFQPIPYDATEFDTDGCRYGSPEKLVCETPGYYLFTAKILLPTGSYYAEIRKNGTKVAGDSAYSSVLGTSLQVTAAVHLEEDDYIECWVKNSGTAFQVLPGTELSMVKVGE